MNIEVMVECRAEVYRVVDIDPGGAFAYLLKSRISKVINEGSKLVRMTRRVDFQLTDEQLTELEQAINNSMYPEVGQRAIAIRVLGLGLPPEKVTEMVMVKANTVWTRYRCYRAQGTAGLQDQPRSGRPRKGTEAYCRLLQETLDTDPAVHGYNFTVCTAERLRDHLEQKTRIRLSIGRFTMLLEWEGDVYRRSKQDLTIKQDQTAKQQATELLDELKRGATRRH